MRASVSNKFLVDSNGQSWPCPHFACPRTESTHEAVELANG